MADNNNVANVDREKLDASFLVLVLAVASFIFLIFFFMLSSSKGFSPIEMKDSHILTSPTVATIFADESPQLEMQETLNTEEDNPLENKTSFAFSVVNDSDNPFNSAIEVTLRQRVAELEAALEEEKKKSELEKEALFKAAVITHMLHSQN